MSLVRRDHMRTNALLGTITPAIAVVYAAATWPAGNRPEMLALAAVLLGLSATIYAAAPSLAASSLRLPVNLAVTAAHLCGYAAFAWLDGGVRSPLGMTVYIGLAVQSVAVPYRPLAALSVIAVGSYWTVVVLSPPTPPGYPWIYTLGFLVITAICARHTRSMASLRHRLGDVARVDPLTGCLNRRGITEHAVDAQAAADLSGTPFTIVLIDLDGFKAVNDTEGHQAGDRLLASTATILREAVRSQDVVGRTGGDEFVALLNGVGPDDCDALVERLRAAIDGWSPASMGVASYPAEATDLDALTHLADTRVYADKAHRAARPPVPSPTAVRQVPQVDRPECSAVSALERRQESIADLARISVANFAIGLTHTLAFRADAPNRSLLVTILATGTLVGLGMYLLNGLVARSARVGTVMTTFTPTIYALAVLLLVVDGGFDSLYAIGTLTPLPIIALGTPKRTSIPIGVVMGVSMVLQAAWVGAPGGWYVATHLLGIGALSVVCGVQGATAARQRRLLHRLSLVDPLTGVLNRRGFERRFAEEVADRRGRGSLSVVVLDLDGFKQVNDSCGHAAGDELLCWVATAIGEVVGTDGVVGRLGGDEFVTLLPNAPGDGPATVADRLRLRLAERIPVSVGTAVLEPDDDDFDDLYRLADSALYADKRSRRRPAPVEARPESVHEVVR